ncbi:MAG: glycosyltransferase [Vicinamibacterales bacterium]
MGQDLPLNVLFVVPYAPTRIRTRPFHFIRTLAALGHRVTVATLWSSDEERRALDSLQSCGVHAVVGEPLTRTRSLWNCARALPTADPLQAHYSWSPALSRRLAGMTDGSLFDVIHVEHLRGARYAQAAANRAPRPGARRPPVIWDSVDCISSLFRRASRESPALRVRMAARFELRRTARFEGRVAARFDRVLMSSSTDRDDLLALAPPSRRSDLDGRVEVVPNGVDLEFFCSTDEPRDPMTLVMTGKMGYHANATAAVRFVGDVMPGVWERVPGVRLLIVGKDPPREVTRLQDSSTGRVVVTGTVDDIRPYLRTAALAVAPIRYGVGIQNKVLEALACATPVVATPQAVSALSVRDGVEVLIGRTSRELGTSIVTLLLNAEHRRALGHAGRAYVERAHNWRGVALRLSDVYRGAIASAITSAV